MPQDLLAMHQRPAALRTYILETVVTEIVIMGPNLSAGNLHADAVQPRRSLTADPLVGRPRHSHCNVDPLRPIHTVLALLHTRA